MALVFIAIALLVGCVNSDNSTITHDSVTDTCETSFGPWSKALEEWAITTQSDRHGRIMALPSTKGYYVTERIDSPFLSPPPPPPPQPMAPNQGHITPSQGYIPQNHGQVPPNQAQFSPNQGPIPQNQGYITNKGPMPTHANIHKPAHAPHAPQSYKEWEATPPPPPGAGKIVNRPPSPHKDKYKPNYQVDRVDDPPRKQVTETDLYLLGAIEKLVYRVDLMEKRLRKMEESVYYVLSAADAKPESCDGEFVRVGASCYSWGEARDWKRAATACRAQHAALAELHEPHQRRKLLAKLLSDKQLRGNDFWTGGLNPGLLWIWSHSARPVVNNTSTVTNSTSTDMNIPGEGRCLSLAFDPARNTYSYRGRDCASQLRYICQRDDDDKLGNEIQRIAKKLRDDKSRKSKVLWDGK